MIARPRTGNNMDYWVMLLMQQSNINKIVNKIVRSRPSAQNYDGRQAGMQQLANEMNLTYLDKAS